MTDWADPQIIIAICTVIVAIFALILSAFSIDQSKKAFEQQQKHDKLTIRPIGDLVLSDFGNMICIKIKNNGTGPMIIKSIVTKKDLDSKEYPIEWMPPDITWENFQGDINNHAIKEGDYIELLKYTSPKTSHITDPNIYIIRSILKDLTISIEYEDIYNTKQPKISRKLDWFGRTIKEQNNRYSLTSHDAQLRTI